jgi:addiction module HigA family antidote
MPEYLVDPKKVTRAPIHPGVIFAEEIMPNLRQSRTIGEIATLLGISRQNLYALMSGRIAMSPDMAARIGALVGNGARIWLAMQANYDAWEATERLRPELKKIQRAGGPNVLTLVEVAAYLRVHPSTVYRLLKERALPAFRNGREWAFDRGAIEKYAKETQSRKHNEF